MNYRLEYSIMGTEGSALGKKEFNAVSDEEAATRIPTICEGLVQDLNNGITSPFWHFSVEPRRLVRIVQPEISTEIMLRPEDQARFRLVQKWTGMGPKAPKEYEMERQG